MIELNQTNGHYATAVQQQQQCSSIGQQAKGLLNFPGQNNCFLNSAVQVLWHLDHFRNSIALFSGHYCTNATQACVFCSLNQLFGQLKNSTRNALDADQLRRALARTFSAQRRFQLGLMDDAIECFEHILQRLHFHCVHIQMKEEECNVYHCLSHGLFSMRLIERRFCTHCAKVTARAPYNQYVQYVSTQALVEKANSFHNNPNIKISFGSLIRLVCTQGEIRDCSVANCGSRVQLRKTLLNAPKVLAIGLNYENERPSTNQIADAFKLVDTFIRLSDVFEIDAQNLKLNSGESNCDVLHLVGLITYYGKHYCTFFFNTQLGTWLYLDDANVKEIGNCWSYVVDKCIKSSFQPLMLLYSSASNQNSINTAQAPTAVYQVPSNIKQNTQNLVNSSINNRRSTSHLSQLVIANQSNKTLLTNDQSDVPDSPFTKSSIASSAYFSDAPDYSSGEQDQQIYISKRTVQSILQATQSVNDTNTHHHSKNQRNSSSSLSDSLSNNDTESNGNSNYYHHNHQNKPPVVPEKPVLFRKELKSADAGYDSYSISSNDSYPSIGTGSVTGSAATSSSGCSSALSNNNGNNNVKSTLRAIQEQSTENLLLTSQLELMNDDNNSTGSDSDKLISRLCSQSDILLLRSHEKERENDFKAAVVLSEAAAQKARAAMDVPIDSTDSHLLISSKMAVMKHSIAVMRSASLMRRIKELEEEEKKMVKSSLRLSRDSLINHQRRASQERLDESNLKKMKQQQLYGTLPKKQSNNNKATIQQPVHQTTHHQTQQQLSITQQQQSVKQISPPNQIPVNLSEQTITRIKSTNTKENKPNKLNRNASSCSTNSIQSNISITSKDQVQQDSNDQYAEIGGLDVATQAPKVGSKQHKIRKKLLISSFIKRKNRSLPDLRDGKDDKSVDEVDCPAVTRTVTESSAATQPTTPEKQIIAKVSRKGFHQLISKDLSHKDLKTKLLNQPVIAPKPLPATKPTTPVKPVIAAKNLTAPAQNEDQVDYKMESEIDIDSLPPPPIEFLNDLRANKEQINRAEALLNNQVQLNNQINENLDNEMKEKASCVKNLASKFEQQINVTTTNVSISNNKPPLPPVVRKITTTTDEPQQSKLNTTTSILKQTTNISNSQLIKQQNSSTGLRVAVFNSRNQPSPTLIYKNSNSSPQQYRPDKPPDYDTTIKRLNQIQQQNSRPSIDSLVSLPSSLNSSLDSPFKNSNNNSTLPSHQIQQLKHQQYNNALAVRKKQAKKSVSFSEEVIIVAHPEDQLFEEHLPNPLLDRVLKQKKNIETN